MPEELSRDELVVLVGEQDRRLAAQDRQITGQAEQIAELAEANEALAAKLAQLEHLLSRNSGNSSSPPSRDDDPGKTPPKTKRRGGGTGRGKGKQRGAPGLHLGRALGGTLEAGPGPDAGFRVAARLPIPSST